MKPLPVRYVERMAKEHCGEYLPKVFSRNLKCEWEKWIARVNLPPTITRQNLHTSNIPTRIGKVVHANGHTFSANCPHVVILSNRSPPSAYSRIRYSCVGVSQTCIA